MDMTCFSSFKRAIRLFFISFHQALLNLGSVDPTLRSLAYNFLCALNVTFDFMIDDKLLAAEGGLYFSILHFMGCGLLILLMKRLFFQAC